MEERLFFIGVAMGLYAWASRRIKEEKALDTAAKAAAWHAAFCALAGFSATLVLVMSFESRARFVSIAVGAVSTAELYPSIAVAAIAGAIGWWRGRASWDKAAKRFHFLNEDSEWAETVFSAVLLAAVLMYFVVQAFKIPSGSMERTLLIGDHLFVNKFVYGVKIPFTGKRILGLKPVSRGDIVVFRFPVDDPRELHCGSVQYRKDFIKRVVAVPGDTVEVRGGVLLLNGRETASEAYAQWVDGPMRQPPSLAAKELKAARYQELWQGHALDAELAKAGQEVPRDFFGPVTVPPGAYFAMGDNRDRSCDSRYWGPVEEKYLKGKAWFIYWPPNRMGLVR